MTVNEMTINETTVDEIPVVVFYEAHEGNLV